MTELDYIKEKFLAHTNILDFYRTSYNKEEQDRFNSYFHFKNTIKNTVNQIKQATTTEEVTESIKKARENFFEIWSQVKNDVFHPVYPHMKNFYYSANLADVDKWIKQTVENYQEKKHNHFFNLVEKGLNFVKDKFPTSEINEVELQDYAEKIINVYQLKSINLSNIPRHKAMDYLKQLDKELANVCNSLGVTSDVMGMNGTIGFVASPHSEAFFSPSHTNICMGGIMVNSNTILHEWIHAVDYHIGCKIRPQTYASEIEKSVYIDDSQRYNEFISIKKITQEIFTSREHVNSISQIKEQIFKEATSKFFSELIGYDFYLLPEDTKKILHTQQAFNAVNNHLLVPDSRNNQRKVLEVLQSANLASEQIESKLKNPSEETLSLKSYFDSINQNIWGKESFYHLSSKLSKNGLKATMFLQKYIDKTVGLLKKSTIERTVGNSSQDDYLIQPKEMLARYFESQVFSKNVLIDNVLGLLTGIQAYKYGVDDNFEDNKNKMIELVFGKDKIVKNISTMRDDKIYKASTTPPTFNKNV